ncbi:MAG: hypothetical protein WDN26_07225 [Chitinophagaceae bacterium]
MAELLSGINKDGIYSNNTFCPEAILNFFDSLLKVSSSYDDIAKAQYFMANAFLELGDEQKAIEKLENLLKRVSGPQNDPEEQRVIMKALAMAYMRLGERTNCI